MVKEGSRSSYKRVPSLISLCQRVACANVESISSLGNGMPAGLIWPILQNCPADVLVRFEQASPEICTETPDVWKALCFRSFPLAAEQHFTVQEPECWRDAYFRLRDLEKERLDAVAARLRVKREEERRRKEDTQIKWTDKQPPIKRSRGGGWGPTPPKTLFQKTRSDAARRQQGLYAQRLNPTTPILKANRPVNSTSASSSKPATTSSMSISTPQCSDNTRGTRVTVAAVPKTRTSPPTTSGPNHQVTSAASLDISLARPNLSITRPNARGGITTPSLSRVSGYPSLPGKPGAIPSVVHKNPTPSLLLSKPRGPVHASTHSKRVLSRA